MHTKNQSTVATNSSISGGNPTNVTGNFHHFTGLSAFAFPGSNAFESLSCGTNLSSSVCHFPTGQQHSAGSSNASEQVGQGNPLGPQNANNNANQGTQANSAISAEESRYLIKMMTPNLGGIPGYPGMQETQIAALLNGQEMTNLVESAAANSSPFSFRQIHKMSQQLQMLHETAETANEGNANAGSNYPHWNHQQQPNKQAVVFLRNILNFHKFVYFYVLEN